VADISEVAGGMAATMPTTSSSATAKPSSPVDRVSVLRHITGFHQDDEGNWVAQLDCLHNQHLRHRPPFQQRPWVITAAGRAERIGSELACPLCDRAEMPDGLTVVRTAGPFDETTLPAGLRQSHQVPAGTWGCLRVREGSVGFWLGTDPPVEYHLEAGQTQVIPPEVLHEVRLMGPVRLVIEFLRR
jgi:tellurite methyltransferase